MNSLKIGIIGVFIILPFMLISFVQVRQNENIRKTNGIVENAVERAMRDGVFALKTYSRFHYDPEQIEKIEIGERETIDSINRSFAYGLNAGTENGVKLFSKNIRLIGFVAYDRLIIYDQKTKQRLELPFFQIEIQRNQAIVHKLNVIEDKRKEDQQRKIQIEKTLEQILSNYTGEKKILLPEQKSTLFGNDYSEVGVFILVQGDPLQIGRAQNYIKIGKVSLSERKGLDQLYKE